MDVNGDYFMVYKPTNITGGAHPVWRITIFAEVKQGWSLAAAPDLERLRVYAEKLQGPIALWQIRRCRGGPHGKTMGKPWENHRKMVISWEFMVV